MMIINILPMKPLLSLIKFFFTILYLMTEFLFLNNFAEGWKVSWKVVLNSEILPLPWKARCGDTKSIFSDYKIKIWKYGTLSLNYHELQENGLFFCFAGPYQTYRNTCVSLFLIKLRACRKFYWKETPTQVFSYCYCEIFKNTCFEKHLRKTASDLYDYYFPIFL